MALVPYITEKSTARISLGTYVFLIDQNDNKKTVEDQLHRYFNVQPTSVRIVNIAAKKVRFKSKPGVRRAIRKAYIQLPLKQKIAGFESLTESKKAAEKAVKEKA